MVRDSVSLTGREYKRDLLVTIKTQPEGVVFGQRLRELRTARNLSQYALADLCGSHKPFISELERVKVIAGDYVLIPGPRIPQFYREMREALVR